MNLTETSLRKFVLLAPAAARIPSPLKRVESDWNDYWNLLDETQRLRGKVYVQDGAIDSSSLIDGGHRCNTDFSSWHLLVLNSQGRISGCARFHEHSRHVGVSELNASRCALARGNWGDSLTGALREELLVSRDANLPFVELGGWALNDEIRGTTEAVRIALATYAFWQMLGGAVSISTVTHRHCAASILRRIGGLPLSHKGRQLPTYYDPQYDCKMELLKFYSWAPNPRYAIWISQLQDELSRIPVIPQPCAMARGQVA